MQAKVRQSWIMVPFLVTSMVACGADDGRPGSGDGTGGGGGRGDGSGQGGEAVTESPTPSEPATEQESSAPSPGESSTSTKKANADGPCASDGECASGVCFAGNTQSYCTVRCTIDDAATTCAAPFTGSCNKQGFCKRD